MKLNQTACAILGILSFHPRQSGYHIRKTIETTVGFFWGESFGQIYPTLKRLAADGLIVPDASSTGNKNRVEYSLTPDGHACLEKWLAVPYRADPPRDEFLLKLFCRFNSQFTCFHNLCSDLSNNECGSNRQFGRSQTKRLTCNHFLNAIHFIQHFAWLNFSYIVLRVTFTIPHPHFRRFLRNWLIRKNTNPNTSTALDVARHSTTCRLNLTRSQASASDGFKTEFAKTNFVSTCRNAGITALLLFTIFSSSWL